MVFKKNKSMVTSSLFSLKESYTIEKIGLCSLLSFSTIHLLFWVSWNYTWLYFYDDALVKFKLASINHVFLSHTSTFYMAGLLWLSLGHRFGLGCHWQGRADSCQEHGQPHSHLQGDVSVPSYLCHAAGNLQGEGRGGGDLIMMTRNGIARLHQRQVPKSQFMQTRPAHISLHHALLTWWPSTTYHPRGRHLESMETRARWDSWEYEILHLDFCLIYICKNLVISSAENTKDFQNL
jgi:hypothetical protein